MTTRETLAYQADAQRIMKATITWREAIGGYPPAYTDHTNVAASYNPKQQVRMKADGTLTMTQAIITSMSAIKANDRIRWVNPAGVTIESPVLTANININPATNEVISYTAYL